MVEGNIPVMLNVEIQLVSVTLCCVHVIAKVSILTQFLRFFKWFVESGEMVGKS